MREINAYWLPLSTMIQGVVVLVVVELRDGLFQLFMKTKILS
jgi:hypothetical protein